MFLKRIFEDTWQKQKVIIGICLDEIITKKGKEKVKDLINEMVKFAEHNKDKKIFIKIHPYLKEKKIKKRKVLLR